MKFLFLWNFFMRYLILMYIVQYISYVLLVAVTQSSSSTSVKKKVKKRVILLLFTVYWNDGSEICCSNYRKTFIFTSADAWLEKYVVPWFFFHEIEQSGDWITFYQFVVNENPFCFVHLYIDTPIHLPTILMRMINSHKITNFVKNENKSWKTCK